VNLSTKLSSRKGNIKSYQVPVSVTCVIVETRDLISIWDPLNLWRAERPCPDGRSK